MARADWFDRQRESATKRPWWLWQSITKYGWPVVMAFGNLQITGRIDPLLLRGPLLLAPNHIGNFDSVALAVAMRQVGLSPRFLVTAGIMQTPVLGALFEKSGYLRVNRGKADAAKSLELVALALEHGAHVAIYPEGRVSLDPDLWPEKGKSGLAALALATGAPVIPISQWGAHEVCKYEDNLAMLTSTMTSVLRRPALKIHFGDPVDLSGLSSDRPRDIITARTRIDAAITRNLVPLRADQLGAPRFVDPTRPIADRPTAAFPGGIVPDELP